MKILTYCDVANGDIAGRLGTPEYSYHFVLEAFHIALAQFADVQRIYAPQIEADPIWQACNEAGEDCLLLSFAPPHRTILGLRCPTIPVFAWEYPDLPQGWEEQSWKSDPRHNWRNVLYSTGAAITLSKHTVRAVHEALGPDFPITAIPTPVWERFESQRSRGPLDPQRPHVDIRMDIGLVDSHVLGLSAEGLMDTLDDDGTPVSSTIDAMLPVLPDCESDLWRPKAMPNDDHGSGSVVHYDGSPHSSSGWDIPPKRDSQIRLAGVVYTAVLTPADGRKNWEDIITAFGWAFRDVADATLVLKLSGSKILKEHHQMLMLLTKLSPLKCRVVALHGYLDEKDYKELIGASTYYVNASLCEGLCMPLLEFLSAGVPALAPDHTSMEDYIDPEFAFVVESISGQPALWPHGDHETYRTSRHRIQWHSLMLAYRESYLVAKNDPGTYAMMSKAALRHMRQYCSTDHVTRLLTEFLSPLARRRKVANIIDRQVIKQP